MSVAENEFEEVSAEQAADLAALHGKVNEQEAGISSAETEGQEPVDLVRDFAGMMTIAVQMLKPMLPSLGEIYTEAAINAAAGAIAAVCNKHGWLQGGMFGEYGEEIAAAFVLVPLAIATNQGIRRDIARAKQKVEQVTAVSVDQAVQPGPDQKTVIMGQPVIDPT